MWWVVAGFAVVAIFWILSRVRLYNKVFSVSHLMEFAHALPALKEAAMRIAMAGEGGAAPAPGDGRAILTSAGLAFVYTIGANPQGRYVHHASVSIPGRVTTHAVGEMFILLWAKLLGVGYERLALEVSKATVHHGEFVLDESEQAAFLERPVETPTENALKAFEAECLKVREEMRART